MQGRRIIFSTEVVELLSSVPGSLLVASPQLDGDGGVLDFTVEWMNDAMRTRVGETGDSSVSLSTLFPADATVEWAHSIIRLRDTSSSVVGYWSLTSARPQAHDVYQVDLKWWGERLVLSLMPLVADAPDIGSAMRTAEAMTKLMPAMPSAYGVLTDEHWLRFPAASFLTVFDAADDLFRSMALIDLVQPRDVDRVTAWLSLPPLERPQPLIFRSDHISPTERWLELWMAPLAPTPAGIDQTGANSFFILRDVDERIRLRNKNEELVVSLNSHLSLMYSALNASRDGFAIWKAIRDDTGKISTFQLVFINDAGAQATGKMSRQLIGKLMDEMMGDDDGPGLQSLFTRALDENEVKIETVDIDSPQGWVGAYENKVVPFVNDQVVASFRDVSEERREKDRLNWLAGHDHLTGLPNRRFLEDNLQAVLTLVRAVGDFAAFVFIDIDNFKAVNDKFGHDVGDQLLRDFSLRLEACLGDEVIFARLAGDEFGIIFKDVSSQNDLSNILEQLLDRMREPFDCAAQSLSITCSAGAALCAGDEPMTEVLRIADKAMYHSKHDGKNRFHIVHI
jgi:diguanylate cyclase (GGDEF)-like protein